MKKLCVLLLAVALLGCVDTSNITALLEVRTTECPTPPPIFDLPSTAAPSTLPLGCPFYYVVNGDTLFSPGIS